MPENDGAWPQYMDRRTAARYVSSKWFATTARAIERWPLTIYRPGKRALHDRDEIDQLAQGMVLSSLVRAA